ncbi:hypothetical protein [Arthrobacter sp. NPDC058127]|uniref:hypothetical protein n=1 Tax=Arthrobacter sp. NPDC058127 TaxID=3346351 RepID=UPI0036F0D56A
MSELNDHPEGPAGLQTAEPHSVELQTAELQTAERQSAGPHDAPWPDDTAPTGDAAVDSALERLAGVSSVPVAEHSGLYAGIHDSLMAALDADER